VPANAHGNTIAPSVLAESGRILVAGVFGHAAVARVYDVSGSGNPVRPQAILGVPRGSSRSAATAIALDTRGDTAFVGGLSPTTVDAYTVSQTAACLCY
jgi:hypothetical protein